MSSGAPKPNQTLDQAAKVLARSNFAKQIIAGSASGLITGTVVGYAGKGVALALGSGIILYQVAHHNGLVSKDLDSIKSLAQQKTNEFSKNTPAINKMRTFATKNRTFSAAFLGGFLLGIAM